MVPVFGDLPLSVIVVDSVNLAGSPTALRPGSLTPFRVSTLGVIPERERQAHAPEKKCQHGMFQARVYRERPSDPASPACAGQSASPGG